MDLIDQDLRQDGRRPDELRQLKCEFGQSSQADGSAYIEQGRTKILAAVYGPHEAKSFYRNRICNDRCFINCQYSMTTFSTAERKIRPRGDRRGEEMSIFMEETLEAVIFCENFPKSQIDVFIEVLEFDGSSLSVSINAACLALVDAGIPMKDLVCCCSASLLKDVALLDVNSQEESSGVSTLNLAILPKSKSIVLLQQTSRLHVDSLEALLDYAMKGCEQVFAVLDGKIRDHMNEMSSKSLSINTTLS